MHLLSVVTIHLNDFPGLARTLRSLKKHLGNERFEWVFIDGGSTKSSDNHGRIFKQAISEATCYISETDNGIYDAMNKGTRMAQGDYVLFLNAGDELHEKFDIESLFSLVDSNQPDMVWGRCIERNTNGTEIELKTRSPAWAWYGVPVYHPAIMFKKDVLGTDPYDTSLQIAADYDLVCKLLVSGAKVKRIPMPVARFYLGGLSDQSYVKTLQEEHEVRIKYFGVPSSISRVIQLLKKGLKRISGVSSVRAAWRKWI
ncbi:glycosyltransferase [Pseudomonadota bacterium]